MAVRCKECSFVAKEDEGFCPDCGAVYMDPEVVDDSEALKPQHSQAIPKKKSGGGLFASLFGGKKSSEPEFEETNEAEKKPVSSIVPEDVSRDELKVRCQECQEIAGIDDHEGYCPGCGAFFVEPLDYVTTESLAQEQMAQAADLEKYKTVVKTFDEMTPQEQLDHLKEKVEDEYDQLVRDRHVLNEKANECMQCFTAAGTIKSNDHFEVMASMVQQRFHNLKDAEMLQTEYKRLLNDFNSSHDKLVAAREAFNAKSKEVNGVSA